MEWMWCTHGVTALEAIGVKNLQASLTLPCLWIGFASDHWDTALTSSEHVRICSKSQSFVDCLMIQPRITRIGIALRSAAVRRICLKSQWVL
jgi:hypothetical protein